MATVADRFEALVDRDGGRHVWRGAVDRNGVPQFRVDRRLTTARCVDWELGPSAPDEHPDNWIPTRPGVGFFIYFRWYGPLEPNFDRAGYFRPRPALKLDYQPAVRGEYNRCIVTRTGSPRTRRCR